MKKRILLIFLLLFGCIFTVTGQEQQNEQHPLLRFLAMIPYEPPDGRHALHFTDYRAIIESRSNGLPIESWDDYERMAGSTDQNERSAVERFDAAISVIGNRPFSFFGAWYRRFRNRYVEVVGFDFFDVVRGGQYGTPRGQVIVLEGEFDEESIARAFTNREYIQHESSVGTLWCRPDGCESVTRTRTTWSHPFDGQMGLEQPVLVSPPWVISSPEFERLLVYAEPAEFTSPSLADLPEYQAAAEAIIGRGSLLQAQFYDGDLLRFEDPAIVDIEYLIDPNVEVDEFELEARQQYIPLPPYSLLFFADLADGEDQVVLVGLVYDDATTAEAAAQAFYARITSYKLWAWGNSSWQQIPLIDRLTPGGTVLELPTLVQQEATGQTVVLVSFRKPLLYIPTVAYSQVWFNVAARVQSDYGWLAIELPESE